MSAPMADSPLDSARPDFRRRQFVGLVSAGLPAAWFLNAKFALANAATALPRRSALVIGNANYPRAPLRNPVNDARLVAGALHDLAFDVQLLEDGSLTQMIRAVRRWLNTSTDAQVRAFYFAGHGTQFRGDNFLVPTDLQIDEVSQIERRALRLSDLVNSLSAQSSGVNFVIVDACRNDPSALIDQRVLTRSIEGALKPGFVPEIAPRGTVVAYSTSPGALAADGVGSRNSVFTQALADNLRRPGVPVEAMFKRIRLSVMRATRNTQVPWETSSLIGDFCFVPNEQGGCGK